MEEEKVVAGWCITKSEQSESVLRIKLKEDLNKCGDPSSRTVLVTFAAASASRSSKGEQERENYRY